MAELRTGIRGSLLASPLIYEFVQTIFGAARVRQEFVREHLRAKSGEKVLDIGCGTGDLVKYLPPVNYIGYEPNESYVAHARTHFPGKFHAKIFDAADAEETLDVDLVIISAVLHHLDDEEASSLFALLRRCLKSTGRIVTIDPVFVEQQNPIARFFISIDRGQNVRTPSGYEELAKGLFETVNGVMQHQRMLPYTRWIMTISGAKP
jgi:SAM-dependent methyltransferase